MKSCFSDLNNLSSFDKSGVNSTNYSNFSHTNSFTNGINSTKNNYLKKNSFNNNNNYNYNYNFNNNYNKYFQDGNNDNDKNAFSNIFYEKLTEDNHALIKNSFQLAEASFALSKYDMNFSGSTCVCVFIIEDRIICGNCGDSRAILVESDKDNKTSSYNNIIIPLSVDHKPELKEEANRIVKNGGRVERRSENGIRTGPLRVWLKYENYPGLAMTRSVGDMVASNIGVTSEPEIIEHIIGSESKYIVVASDGIWEIFSNEEVAAIVSPYYNSMDVENAAEKLVNEAAKKWKKVK